MPKMKTRKAVAKRFTLTASDHVKRKKAFKSHILTKKTTKRKRDLRKMSYVHKSQEDTIRRMIAR